MSQSPRVVTIGLAIAVVIAASGCECAPARSKPWRHAPEPTGDLQGPPSSEVLAAESTRVAALARRRHTLRVHMDRQPRHLNPLVSPSQWTIRATQDTVFETLVRYRPPAGGAGSGPGRYEPGLARSWSVAPSGREIRIDLEPDVNFHDGRRMTSVDVQFSLDSARSPRIPAGHLRRHLSDVLAVELLGPRTLRIRLDRPNGYVLRALADVPILPAHVYDGKLVARRGPVVGTGPYRLESWQDDIIRLSRHDSYWGPAPAIANIELVHQPDAAAALTAAKRGEIDLVPALIPAHYPEQASAPGVVSSFVPVRMRPPELRYVVMSASKPPLDDPKMRHALALLIDRATVVKEAHDGLARLIAGPIWPGGPGDGPAPAPPAFDPGRAAQLMDRAGWSDGDGDGVRERDGVRLRLVVLAVEDSDRRLRAERDQVLRGFRRAGIRLDLRIGTPAVLRNRLRDGDFDLAFIEWRAAVDSDLAPLMETGGDDNHGRLSNRRIDAALASLRLAWDPSSRAPLMAELARAFTTAWPIVPLSAPDPYGLVHRRVGGVVVWNGWLSLRDLSLAPPAE